MQNQKQGIAYRQEHRQTMKLAPRQLHSLNMLAMSLPQLRAEIAREISENPAIEDVDSPLETPLSSVERERVKPSSADETDYPDEDFEPGGSYDEEAAERRQAFFDNQVGEETLQRHLLAQLPLSDIPREDWPLAEMLIGDLDDNGYYKGSAADAAMAFGRTEKAVDAILGQIAEFDPPGCGARNVRECLLAQLDAIGDERLRELAGRLIARHLDDLAAGRTAET
ncbi:MAG: hypothetical protein ILO34_07370, partial [Kiritimatiellae bacterium]|nr:hypothetical protein [Kiritimatiellia bacterium]